MSRPPQCTQARPHYRRAAATRECGFIFPLLFMLVYGSVIEGFLFTARDSADAGDAGGDGHRQTAAAGL